MFAAQHLAGLTAYRRAGPGGPVLFLHGIGSRGFGWEEVADALPDPEILAWDAPGYGESRPLESPDAAPADFAERAVALLAAAGMARATIVGHSLGALIAGAIARRFPDRVASLFLADPALGYGDRPQAERRAVVTQRLAAFSRLGAAAHARERAPRLLSAHAGGRERAAVTAAMASLNERGYRAAACALANGNLAADLSAWCGATTIVSGAEDAITPPAGARSLAGRIGAPFHLIPKAGHACYVERPRDFAALLGAHLATTES